MSKRKITGIAIVAALGLLIVKLSMAIPVLAAQAEATATPPPRPSPFASATFSEALVTIEQDTLLFAQPDNTSEVFFAVPAGAFARLQKVTLDRRWYQILIGNTTGWVSSTAAQIVGNPTGLYEVIPLPSTPPAAGATPTIAPIATERMVGAYPTVLIRNRSEVYTGMSPFYPSIGLIMPGQVVEILAVSISHRDWYLVRYENGAGWIYGQLDRDIQGDIIQVPHLTPIPDEPTADYSRYLSQSSADIVPFLASPTPSSQQSVSPTQAAGPGRVAELIDIILEPDVPAGSFAPEQITAAAETIRARIAEYPITDYSVEVDTVTNTIHVRFADNYYREEIIRLTQQEGLFEAVNFSAQSVELRAALRHETILTSGYRKRESEQIRIMNETYNTNNMGDLVEHGFSFSSRLRNPLEINHPFNTVLDDQSVAGASMVQGRNLWDVVVTLTDEGAERIQSYPLNSFIAFTLDGTIMTIPLAIDVIPSPFTLSLRYEENQARMLVVMLRSGSLPFAMRARQITYVNNG
jgi:uncharacterized protein YraI